MEANELIERYIHEVGRHLPRTNREDIKLELKSLFLDTIEEQTAKTGHDTGQQATTKMVAEYLREFGKPEEIAARYGPEQLLIGRQLFPYYRIVLTIALGFVGAVHLLGLLFSLIQNGPVHIGEAALGLLRSFGETALINIGLITLIFAGIQRLAGAELELKADKAADWDPYQLPPVEDPDRIDHFEIIAGIFFAALFIIVFNFFYDSIGFIDLTGEDAGLIPILAPGFRQHLPWLTASFALDGLLKLVVLVQGRWNKGTRWLQMATYGFGIFVMVRILNSDIISTIPFFTTILKGGVIIVILIEVLEMLKILARLLFGRPIRAKNLFQSVQ